MPRLRMRTSGSRGLHDRHQTLIDLGLEERAERSGDRPAGCGGGGRTGAARTICGMWAGGTACMRANSSSDAALRPVENQTNSPPITARATAPITQTGTTTRAGR